VISAAPNRARRSATTNFQQHSIGRQVVSRNLCRITESNPTRNFFQPPLYV
jgi:hypothetical protein